MKSEIKLEHLITPKNNITPNPDCVVLTPITDNHKNSQPKVQTEPQKTRMDSPSPWAKRRFITNF